MYEMQLDEIVLGSRAILSRLNLSLCEGEVLCILGPSGCGKTTILNELAGLGATAPWQNNQPEVGYLFQEPRLLPWRTLKQNLMIVHPDGERVMSILKSVKLERYADYYPSQISLGMARRAALARCLLCEPDIVLMDEPLASLDMQTAHEMLVLISDLVGKDPRRSMIYVTHDPDEALAIGDQIAVLKGSPASLFFYGEAKELDLATLETMLR